MKKFTLLLILLVVLSSTGCALKSKGEGYRENTGDLTPSPCAGCEFEPLTFNMQDVGNGGMCGVRG